MQNMDKLYHFVVGLGIAVFFGMFMPALGLAAGVLAGVLKEVYDKLNPEKHTTDAMDMVVTIVGAMLGYMIITEVM